MNFNYKITAKSVLFVVEVHNSSYFWIAPRNMEMLIDLRWSDGLKKWEIYKITDSAKDIYYGYTVYLILLGDSPQQVSGFKPQL